MSKSTVEKWKSTTLAKYSASDWLAVNANNDIVHEMPIMHKVYRPNILCMVWGWKQTAAA